MSSGNQSLDISSATDEELRVAQKDAKYDHLYYEIVAEILRRSNSAGSARQVASPRIFDPRSDVSADAKYLWKNVFIWFWLVPAFAVILYVLLVGHR